MTKFHQWRKQRRIHGIRCYETPFFAVEEKVLRADGDGRTNGQTDERMDGRTDRRTDITSYRDAWMHLKKVK